MAWALKLPLTDEVIESGLVQDFDASLSGIGQELGAGAYSMRYSISFCVKNIVGLSSAAAVFMFICAFIKYSQNVFLICVLGGV